MSLQKHLDAVKDSVPHYWPIGTFIHHNPLKGFEHLNFKEGLEQAQKIFGGKVYMEPAYYLSLYNEGKIAPKHLEENLKYMLDKTDYAAYVQEAKKFILDISPKWESLRNYETLKVTSLDESLVRYLTEHSIYNDHDAWLASLCKHMTLYEVHDAIFGTSEKELIEKDTIEFLSRFLDQQQTTLSMQDRDLGMFKTFQLYEDIDYVTDAESYVHEVLEELKVRDPQSYFLTHLLKLHGWAGYIKYRSGDKDYYPQRVHPSTLMDYMAIRLHFERKYMHKEEINNFDKLDAYMRENRSYAILKLLQSKGKLTGTYNDALEDKKDFDQILSDYISEQISLDALRIQQVKEALPELARALPKFCEFITFLKREEGFLWLKSLEDTYIHEHVEAFTQSHTYDEKPFSATLFCLDVRSEVIRRNIEASGPHKTYGIGGFLGIPISFVPFDKSHQLNLSPAFIKPHNLVFEVPVEPHEEYNRKKKFSKTVKKVLTDLKNNPYTPYILVESIGWLFAVKLFGKTFFPKRTEMLFKKFEPVKPKTSYTLDKLEPEEVTNYLKKLYHDIIKEVLVTQSDRVYSDEDIDALYEHLIFGEPLHVKISQSMLDELIYAYHITPEDYEEQKEKLMKVGFTLEEQLTYFENLLKTIGLVKDFPRFVIITGHGSVSDNNPFESALDCGACGGNVSLPNARSHCMIGNKPEIRTMLRERGIDIPDETHFLPALHNTTTDEVTFYDKEQLDHEALQQLKSVEEDFKKAAHLSRMERLSVLPNADNEEDIFLKTMDWSEPRPEWGLARNMGVFAGPRESIRHLKFENRLFLHSYDADIDTDDAEILTRIFNGPLVVGEWINLEHYFSVVDNAIYGAGSKVYHNIVSKVGVYNGNYSDLKIGLPTQSVLLEGKAYHEPVRLLTYMEAPLEKVGKAVENSSAKEFILNEWIRPVIIDKEARKVYSYEYGDFKVIKEF